MKMMASVVLGALLLEVGNAVELAHEVAVDAAGSAKYMRREQSDEAGSAEDSVVLDDGSDFDAKANPYQNQKDAYFWDYGQIRSSGWKCLFFNNITNALSFSTCLDSAHIDMSKLENIQAHWQFNARRLNGNIQPMSNPGKCLGVTLNGQRTHTTGVSNEPIGILAMGSCIYGADGVTPDASQLFQWQANAVHLRVAGSHVNQLNTAVANSVVNTNVTDESLKGSAQMYHANVTAQCIAACSSSDTDCGTAAAPGPKCMSCLQSNGPTAQVDKCSAISSNLWIEFRNPNK